MVTDAQKVIVITGASSGIGMALAVQLSKREHTALVLVGRNEHRLQAVADECSHAEVLCIATDLSDDHAAATVIQSTLDRFGRLDTLVVNAGLYFGGDLDDAEPESIDALLGINILGSIQLVRAALPTMRRSRRGDIMLVTSVSGYQDIHWEPVYSASKHAMVSFAHTLRRQLVGSGIRVMSIGPGVVLTELWGFQSGDDRISNETAAGRGIEVSQVTDAICFMLDRDPHVTIRDLVILPTNQEI